MTFQEILIILSFFPTAICLLLVIKERDNLIKIALSGFATSSMSLFVVTFALLTKNYMYLDIAIVYALMSFMGAIGYSKILNKEQL